jgi:hypothetical protein
MENTTNTRQRNRISTNGTWQLVYIAKAPKYLDLQSESKSTNDPLFNRPARNQSNNYNTTLSEIFK